MAYAPHVLAAFGGNLPNGDIWQCGVRLKTATGQLDEADVDQYMEAMATQLATWFGTASTGIAATTQLTYLKLNNIGADGKYPPGVATHQHDFNPVVVGGQTLAIPAITSVCLSWTTDVKRGPGAHGRVYVPNLGYAPASTGKVGNTAITNGVAAAQGLLDAVSLYQNPGALGRLIPVVASKVNATLTAITGVRVGDEYDVQRRRKNAAPEVYTSAAWANVPG